MIWTKVYTTQEEVLLAACDENLLGRTFEEGELSLCVSESFYGGERVQQEVFIEQLKLATIINLVGREVIEIASRLEMLDQDTVIEIDGVPHAQIARLV